MGGMEAISRWNRVHYCALIASVSGSHGSDSEQSIAFRAYRRGGETIREVTAIYVRGMKE